MTKVRPEYSYVETAPVAKTHDSLWPQLIRDAQPRPECAEIVSNIAVQSERAKAAHSDDALIKVRKTSVALGIHGFGEIVLPPNAVCDRQFAAHPELVLGVQEKAFLTFCCSLAHAGETLEMVDIT